MFASENTVLWNVNDPDIFAFEKFVVFLEKELRRSESDYDKVRRVSEDLLSLMLLRCVSCGFIADNSLELETSSAAEAIDFNSPLNTENCLAMLHESSKNGNSQLNSKVLRFIKENFLNVVNSKGELFYRRVSVNVFETLLESENLKIKNEDDVLLAVRKWLQFDFRQRRRFALQLLQKV